MKQKFIPLEKQSKRNQKEKHATQRMDWGSISPVTRKVENGKAYNRKKSKQRWHDFEPGLGFFISPYKYKKALHPYKYKKALHIMKALFKNLLHAKTEKIMLCYLMDVSAIINPL